ncbi:MAG: extracellular solute-binding protein [Lachnospiraceae bacterium]|nr:extracellular solute-binding protein [Lachnospiraceae bacterium]
MSAWAAVGRGALGRAGGALRALALVCLALACLALGGVLLIGCGAKDVPGPKNPVTVTIWHTYVEQMRTDFDALIADFNATVGQQNGITVKVTAVANSSVLNESLISAAKKDPGSPELPDLAVIYPKTAVTLAAEGALADLGGHFTDQELSVFVPQFLEEGKLGGDTLYLLPIAKSTEVLYVNRTIFDRFSADTGVGIGQLATFEGILDAAGKYYDWTDAQTPDVPGDGKAFYYPDGLFNYSMTGFLQLGSAILTPWEVGGAAGGADGAGTGSGGADGANLGAGGAYGAGGAAAAGSPTAGSGGALPQMNLRDPIFAKIWDSYFGPAVRGEVPIYNDYGNYLAITGDIVCCTSTSAGASFYPTRVTYGDNTKEDVVFDVLPYPVFEGGQRIVYQRGGGMCVFASDALRENAAAIFLKWFTAPEQNLRFTAATGYIPVTEAAFAQVMEKDFPAISNPLIEKALITVVDMRRDGYEFYYPPVFDGFEKMQADYVEQMQRAATEARGDYRKLLGEGDPVGGGGDPGGTTGGLGAAPGLAYEAVAAGALEEFLAGYR